MTVAEWDRAVAMSDAKGMNVVFRIKGPVRVKTIRVDLVDDGSPGYELLMGSTTDGRDVRGVNVMPTKIGRWDLLIGAEDERGCQVTAKGDRTVTVVK